MRERIGLVFSVLAVALLGVSVPAFAQELSIEGGLTGVNITDESYRALTARAGAGGAGVNFGLEFEQIPRLRFLAGYGAEGMSGSRFDWQLGYSVGQHEALIGADYGVDLVEGLLRPLVRVQGGYIYRRLSLKSDRVSYSDGAHGVAGLVAGGLELALGRASGIGPGFLSRVSVGANILGGYKWQTRAQFDEMESGRKVRDDDPWGRASYDAGELGGSGWYFRLGAVIRYRFGG